MFKLDAEAFLKDIKHAIDALPTKVNTALTRTSSAAAAYARVSRLYKSHTYGLRGSIQDNGIVSDSKARISANAAYANIVENGSKEHQIQPRRKKVLRFIRNGEVEFRTRVWHPGTQPRPFMTEASVKATPLFERLCIEAADSMFR